MPPAPYATGPDPGRDMPMAGRSPIRRNIDDTAELPAFLDSAMSDESPNRDFKVPERKGVTRKFPGPPGSPRSCATATPCLCWSGAIWP
ncbi:hypothetical protein GCM10029992_05880 [Glycomyces albus]